MTRVLVIHDEEGLVLSIRSVGTETIEPVGVPFFYQEVPLGKKVKGVTYVDLEQEIPQLPLESSYEVTVQQVAEKNEVLKEQIINLWELFLLGGDE